MKLAVIDCDGTLVDGQAPICEAMEAGFAAAQLPAPSRHDIRRIVGLSLPRAVSILAPNITDDQNAVITEFYKQAFRESRMSGRLEEPLFEDMAELLTDLKNAGWELAVATGKSDRGLVSCLQAHGIADLFISLQTADRHPSKPDPAMLEAALYEAGAQPADAVMIGDTTYDMAMAHAAGVHSIGVSWGYHSVDELRDSGAHHIVNSCAELFGILHRDH